MKTLIISSFSIFIIMICQVHKLKAQSSDSNQVETILKTNPKTATPFKPSQIRWLTKNGINTTTYQWDNAEVNSNLKGSITMRNISYVTTGTGIFFGLVGLLGHVSSGLMESQESRDSAKKTANNLLVTSGIFFSASIVLSLGSDGKVKKARNMQMKMAN